MLLFPFVSKIKHLILSYLITSVFPHPCSHIRVPTSELVHPGKGHTITVRPIQNQRDTLRLRGTYL